MSARYKPNGTPLTDYEREVLVILMEECAEVIQAASKMIRFGKENRPNSCITNSHELSLELGDLGHMVDLASRAKLITDEGMFQGESRKRERLLKYMQTTAP